MDRKHRPRTAHPSFRCGHGAGGTPHQRTDIAVTTQARQDNCELQFDNLHDSDVATRRASLVCASERVAKRARLRAAKDDQSLPHGLPEHRAPGYRATDLQVRVVIVRSHACRGYSGAFCRSCPVTVFCEMRTGHAQPESRKTGNLRPALRRQVADDKSTRACMTRSCGGCMGSAQSLPRPHTGSRTMGA